MPEPKTCQAYQCSDQMICPRCEYAWDTNDPAPPVCKPSGGKARDKAMVAIKRRLHDD